jgi:hypothetical protein
MTTLYASHYTSGTDVYLSVYQGIFETRSTNSNKVYPSVKSLGCINISTRTFYKYRKHPQKVIEQDGVHIKLNGYQRQYTELNALAAELGYSTELLNEIITVVTSKAHDSSIKLSEGVTY